MKKLLFSLLALVCSVSMMAANVVFSYTTSKALDKNSTESATGGSILFGNGVIEDKIVDFATKLDGSASEKNSKYVKCTLDSPIAVGDVIKIVGYAGSSAKEGQSFTVANDRQNSVVYFVTDYNEIKKNAKSVSTHTVAIGENIVGVKELIINRTASSVFFSGITIERENVSETAAGVSEISADKESVEKGNDIIISAKVTGYPVPEIKWYSCDDAKKTNSVLVEDQKTATLTVNKEKAGTYYYYCTATNTVDGSEVVASSDVIAIEFTEHKASSEKQLTEVKFSNGFNAFIKDPHTNSEGTLVNGKVSAFYLANTGEPTVNANDIKCSAGATCKIESNVLTVTAEDQSTAKYDIVLESVEPYSGSGLQFDGNETWVKTGGAYKTADNNKTYYAWVINKNADTDKRIPEGKTRIYFFVNAASTVSLINDRGTSLSSDRAIKVYVNGKEYTNVTIMPKYVSDTSAPAKIEILVDGPSMIEITANQTSGDTGWGKIEIAPVATPAINADGFGTFSCAKDVEIKDAEVYTGKLNDAKDKIVFTKVEDGIVPAGNGVLLFKKGTTEATTVNAYAVKATDESFANNDLKATTLANGNLAEKANSLVLSGKAFKNYTGEAFAPNKAYLPWTVDTAQSLAIEFEGEETAIAGVGAAEAQPAKAVVVVENGKLVIVKANGEKFSVAGARM